MQMVVQEFTSTLPPASAHPTSDDRAENETARQAGLW